MKKVLLFCLAVALTAASHGQTLVLTGNAKHPVSGIPDGYRILRLSQETVVKPGKAYLVLLPTMESKKEMKIRLFIGYDTLKEASVLKVIHRRDGGTMEITYDNGYLFLPWSIQGGGSFAKRQADIPLRDIVR